LVTLATLREKRKEKERTGTTERRGDERKKEKTDPQSFYNFLHDKNHIDLPGIRFKM